MKSCRTCGVEKPLEDYYPHPNTADRRTQRCKKCHNRESRRYERKKILNDRSWYLWRCAKKRSKKQGILFALSPSDIHVPEYCPVLGIRLKDTHGKLCDASPSLDKIIPERGYVPGNVVVVSYKANSVKRNTTLSELQAVAQFYTNLMKDIPSEPD